MYIQDVESVYDLVWACDPVTGREVSYGDVYHQNEVELSTYNFEHADAAALFARFNKAEAECKKLLAFDVALTLPASERMVNCSNAFNLLDARDAITEIGRAPCGDRGCQYVYIKVLTD